MTPVPTIGLEDLPQRALEDEAAVVSVWSKRKRMIV